MDWHVFESDLEPAPPQERTIVPAGRQTLTIKSASEGPHRFLDGDFLMMRLASEKADSGLVFCDIGQGRRDQALAAALSAAIGGPATGQISIDPKALEGQTVDAEIVHATGKDGIVRPRVSTFYAKQAPAQAAPAHKRARTADQKIRAEQRGGGDDIPF